MIDCSNVKDDDVDIELLQKLCDAVDKLLISVVHLQIRVYELNEEIKKFSRGI